VTEDEKFRGRVLETRLAESRCNAYTKRRAARAAPPSTGAAVILAPKPDEVELVAPPPAPPPAAPEAPLAPLEAPPEALLTALETAELTEEDKLEREAFAADLAEDSTDEPDALWAAPAAVNRVVEPTVEVSTLLPEETVVRTAPRDI
jgi:hypothetical protein